jgi:uncharacterized protein (TIGR00255 family)
MTRSMTAFARRQAETERGVLTWELRSVNHRYLEIGLRLPEELRALEPAVREAAARRLARGKLDAVLNFTPRTTPGESLALDEQAARRVLEAAGRLERLGGASGVALAPLATIELLRWPGVLVAPALDVDDLARAALATFEVALDELVAARSREGARLRDFLLERLAELERILAQLRAIVPEIEQGFRARLEARLGELAQALDPARLEQEIVLFVNRSDVTEELARLAAHAAEVRAVLDTDGSVGRRLDFLMQELNREANTLAAKSADLRMTRAAVDLKVLIEQMREQVQNVE